MDIIRNKKAVNSDVIHSCIIKCIFLQNTKGQTRSQIKMTPPSSPPNKKIYQQKKTSCRKILNKLTGDAPNPVKRK